MTNFFGRGPLELATVVAGFAVAAAVALSQFAEVSELWIVTGTIIAATAIGWWQPEARLRTSLQPARSQSSSVVRPSQ